MTDLSGKIAIVTGAASGIGAAAAKRLTEDGATVIATDIQSDLGEKLAQEIGAHFEEQDIGDPERWAEIIDLAKTKYGRLDILVNNAGFTVGQSIEEIDLENWDRGLRVLLTGVMLGCQNAIGVMKDNPGGSKGSIINIASTTAYTALPNDITYTTAKSGVRMMTKSIAVHCAQQGYNIRCNTIIPGATDTAILASLPDEVRAAIAATSPLNRLADPAETAAAIAFLSSDECNFMTGSEMTVDGGALAIHPGF